MGRIDLQLFAIKLNTDTSVVDYLKSQGQDSSYSNRKKLASQYGISNYTGSESQNINLLKMLKNSSASNSTGNKAAGSKAASGTAAAGQSAATGANKGAVGSNTGSANGKAPAATGKQDKGSAVADTVADTGTAVAQAQEVLSAQTQDASAVAPVTQPVTQPAAERQPFVQTQAPTYTPQQYGTPTFTQVQTPTYNGQTTQANQATTIDQRLPADTLAALNSQFQVSQAYQQAMDYTNGLLQQLSGGKTAYSDQISQLISDYQNREKFSYNADADPLFQQALSSAMRTGKSAMQDTMGQAAALTGGYGSSYATGVGANAYNQYIQEAYDAMPEYYQLAMEAYNMEGQNMLNQLSVMDNADSKEYDRLYNAYNMNYNNAQNLYNQEYGAWQDSVNNAYNYAGLLNSDYWNKMDYDENIRQYDQNFGYQQYQDALSQSNWQNQFNYQQYADQVAQNQWASEFDYKKYQDSVTQNNWQNEFGYQQYRDDINQGNVEWEQGFKESESNRDQSNIEWEQNFSKDESIRDQGNIDWEHGYKESESNRDQSNIDWEHGFKESESDRDQSNIEWEQNFTQDEANRDQSNWEKEYSQDVYEFDASLGEDKRQFDASLGEDQRQFDEKIAFDKTQAAQDQANFEREMAIKESQARAEEAGEEYDYKTPNEKMFTAGLQAAIQGGESAVVAYCDTIGDYDGFAIVDYVQKKLTFTKTKETSNGPFGLEIGVDHNDVFVDGYGQTYTLDEISDVLGLPKAQLKKLTALKEGAVLDLFSGN